MPAELITGCRLALLLTSQCRQLFYHRPYIFVLLKLVGEFNFRLHIGFVLKRLQETTSKPTYYWKNRIAVYNTKDSPSKRNSPLQGRTFQAFWSRHAFATRFIESGGNIVILQTLLGHSNIQMVTCNDHPTEKHQFDAIKKMEEERLKKTTAKMKKCA